MLQDSFVSQFDCLFIVSCEMYVVMMNDYVKMFCVKLLLLTVNAFGCMVYAIELKLEL